MGERLRERRERKQMTQSEVATLLGLSRAAIAQWESNTTSPSIHTIEEVSEIYETTPEWLAFGFDGTAQAVYQPAEGLVAVPEVVFGDKIAERSTERKWNLPYSYLKEELHCLSTEGVILWRVASSNMTPTYEPLDLVVVDTKATKPSPSGVFLLWDGIGPTLHQVAVVPVKGVAWARISSTDGAETYEMPAEDILVIGRVRGLYKSV